MSESEDAKPALTPAEQIDAEAAAWFNDRNDGTADRAEFDAWVAQSPNHLLAYWRVEAGWDRAGLLAAVRPPKHNRSDEPDRRPWGLWFGRIAAIVAVVGIGVAATYEFSSDKFATYTTPVGGHRTLTLADGSQIELNTDTTVRVDAAGKDRRVELVQGEAYFSVKHDKRHPFVVDAGEQRLVDLGTKFLLRRNAQSVKVGLFEGSIRLETPGLLVSSPLTVLAAGDMAVATPGKVLITRGATRELNAEAGWRAGRLIFDHTTLAEAAAEFNRYNDLKLVIADDHVGAMKFSSAFPTSGIEAFIRVAQKSLGLHVERRDGEVLISN
ncbi:MAG TPA: FecR domain-containing protein [Rhizomicrobium sp.]|jgi:transmembrane sensor